MHRPNGNPYKSCLTCDVFAIGHAIFTKLEPMHPCIAISTLSIRLRSYLASALPMSLMSRPDAIAQIEIGPAHHQTQSRSFLAQSLLTGLGNWLFPDTGNRWWYMPIDPLSLSQIRSGRIGDAIRRGLGQALYDRMARWRVMPASPCPKIGVYESDCSNRHKAKQMAKMPLAKHQDMVKAFPSDQPLTIAILPG